MASTSVCHRTTWCGISAGHPGECEPFLTRPIHCRCTRPHPTYTHAAYGVIICGRCLRPYPS